LCILLNNFELIKLCNW